MSRKSVAKQHAHTLQLPVCPCGAGLLFHLPGCPLPLIQSQGLFISEHPGTQNKSWVIRCTPGDIRLEPLRQSWDVEPLDARHVRVSMRGG